MARFRVDGLDDLLQDFDRFAKMPEDVQDKMLNAEADILVEAQRKTARSMLTGPYSKGIVAKNVIKGKVKKAKDGKVLHITFEGSVTDKAHKKGTRVAEIAFINEFGKENQPARPFIQTANEQFADEAVEAARDVHDKWLNEIGL